MSELKVSDITGNPLKIGSLVEYVNTGTKGTVTEIISDDEGLWALIDKTNLFYKPEVLKIISSTEEKELVEKELSRAEINEALEKQIEAAKSLESGEGSQVGGG
ncbi:MAG: DUF2098 family protein [Candidatus Methanoperedens sp.]|nr:DUF2098 family protein [Candidatus Methanoperedens sp.]